MDNIFKVVHHTSVLTFVYVLFRIILLNGGAHFNQSIFWNVFMILFIAMAIVRHTIFRRAELKYDLSFYSIISYVLLLIIMLNCELFIW